MCVYDVYMPGDVYGGFWMENKRHGRGAMTWQSAGSVFVGVFKNDRLNTGRLFMSPTESYDAEFRSGDEVVDGARVYKLRLSATEAGAVVVHLCLFANGACLSKDLVPIQTFRPPLIAESTRSESKGDDAKESSDRSLADGVSQDGKQSAGALLVASATEKSRAETADGSSIAHNDDATRSLIAQVDTYTNANVDTGKDSDAKAAEREDKDKDKDPSVSGAGHLEETRRESADAVRPVESTSP